MHGQMKEMSFDFEVLAPLDFHVTACEKAGFWKLVSRVFTDNTASRRLIGSLGFREVGVYEKHGQLDGVWRDVVIVERLIHANIDRNDQEA